MVSAPAAAKVSAGSVLGMTMSMFSPDVLKGKLLGGRCLIVIGTEGRRQLRSPRLPRRFITVRQDTSLLQRLLGSGPTAPAASSPKGSATNLSVGIFRTQTRRPALTIRPVISAMHNHVDIAERVWPSARSTARRGRPCGLTAIAVDAHICGVGCSLEPNDLSARSPAATRRVGHVR
jgi:hypothetical protein